MAARATNMPSRANVCAMAPDAAVQHTWAPQDPFTPAPKSEAMQDYEYDLKRVMDEHGKIIDQASIDEAKAIFGENVVMLTPGMPEDVVKDVVIPVVGLFKMWFTFIMPIGKLTQMVLAL